MASEKAKRHVIFWSAAGGGAALDLVSKALVCGWLEGLPGKHHVVLQGFFSLHMDRNTGTCFGLMAGSNAALTIFTLLMMGMVLYMFLAPPRVRAGRSRLYTLALGLVLAGAAGNLYDRARFGYVRDFIALSLGPELRWPTFNLADAWLTAGIIVYMVALLLLGREAGEGEAGKAPGGD